MKYPECCYRMGNGFLFDQEDFKQTERDIVYSSGHYDIKVFYETEEIMHHKDSYNLASITAETLAELVRENKDEIEIYFETVRIVVCDVKVYNDEGVYEFNQNYMDEEPLGEFFLRVAKERKYIK